MSFTFIWTSSSYHLHLTKDTNSYKINDQNSLWRDYWAKKKIVKIKDKEISFFNKMQE